MRVELPMRLVFVLLAVAAFTSPAFALQAREPSPPPEEFAGCWRDAADPTHFVEFEEGRTRELVGGELNFARTLFDIDHAIRHVWGRRDRWDFSLEGEQLIVTSRTSDARGTTTQKFERLKNAKERPAALDPKPLELGKTAPGKPDALTPERLAAIQAEMAKRKERDQAVRTGTIDAGKMEAVDVDNTAWLTRLVGEVGWLDQTRFGPETALGAFLIVQHSGELPLMLAALPEIEKDVKEHGLDPQNFALLFDRLRVRLGEKQRYGSQLGTGENHQQIVIALEDRKHVDALRKAMRLVPLATYLDLFRQQDKAVEIVFEDDLGE